MRNFNQLRIRKCLKLAEHHFFGRYFRSQWKMAFWTPPFDYASDFKASSQHPQRVSPHVILRQNLRRRQSPISINRTSPRLRIAIFMFDHLPINRLRPVRLINLSIFLKKTSCFAFIQVLRSCIQTPQCHTCLSSQKLSGNRRLNVLSSTAYTAVLRKNVNAV